MRDYILYPWLCAVVIMTITILSAGSSSLWVLVPALLICGVTGFEAWKGFKQNDQKEGIFWTLLLLAGFAAFVVSIITYIHFLRPYNMLGGGASYFNVLPSQSAMGAADATAIVFAPGTRADISRTYGYIDARNPTGTMYCVAPLSNQYTIKEPGVQFFAAGINCCGKKSGFGCGEGGSGARGALVMAREENAEPGFRKAVEGATVAYNLMPSTGYLLLEMVPDPIQYRNDKWDSAVKFMLIFALVYLIIASMTGYLGYKQANGGLNR